MFFVFLESITTHIKTYCACVRMRVKNQHLPALNAVFLQVTVREFCQDAPNLKPWFWTLRRPEAWRGIAVLLPTASPKGFMWQSQVWA